MNGRAMTEAAIQKRKEREQKRAKQIALAIGTPASDSGPDPIPVPLPSSSQPVLPSESPTPSIQGSARVHPHTVIVPTTSSPFEWYSPDGNSYSTIASAKAAGIWNYPATLQERARCGVFKGLWEQGYFMGGGIKFGGDYLVYPGQILNLNSLKSVLKFSISVKATHSVIIRISLHPSWTHPHVLFEQWKLLLTVGWALRHESHIYCAGGTMRNRRFLIFPSSGLGLVDVHAPWGYVHLNVASNGYWFQSMNERVS